MREVVLSSLLPSLLVSCPDLRLVVVEDLLGALVALANMVIISSCKEEVDHPNWLLFLVAIFEYLVTAVFIKV